MRSLAKLQPYALLLIRIIVGLSMVYHSWDKVMPTDGLRHAYYNQQLLAPEQHFNTFVASLGMPAWSGYFSTATEFLGGLFLIAGLFARFCALLITINMLVALLLVNRHHGYTGSEYSLALLAMAFLLFTAGSGAFSLDRRFGIS